MLQEAKDLQKESVTKLLTVLATDKKEITFKAPTGSGKTFMMSDLMNHILSSRNDVVFIVSTLSKSNLAEQNYNSFKELSETGTFPYLKPYLISSDEKGEGNLYIPLDYNVYVLPRDLYKKNARLKEGGTLLNFLYDTKGSLEKNLPGKEVYLIKDECHIATSNLDELNGYFSKIINFSATPKLARKQNPDVSITYSQAESVKLIKTVEEQPEEPLNCALEKLEEIQGAYINKLKVNPCLIIQISNKDKAEEEWNNQILPALNEHQELKWVYIAGEDKSCKTNDDGLNKIKVSKWKDYMREKTSTISVIIFKMVISEGWDIPRACMLYQIRDSKSRQLDEQVVGRVRRNPRLVDFENLDEEAQDLACTSWVWGILSDEVKSAAVPVKLADGKETQKEILITTTRIKIPESNEKFNFTDYIDGLDTKPAGDNIFVRYRELQKQNNDIQKLCHEYSVDYQKWFKFSDNLNQISDKFKDRICDYEKTMFSDALVSFPLTSGFDTTDNTLPIDDWIWCRADNEDEFSFDSEAERKWAMKLHDLRNSCIQHEDTLELNNAAKFYWGKNFPFNSEIKFEYYLNGSHFSYPDFVMKDKKGKIHIFEVKSENQSSASNIDKDEYDGKIKALKDCYKECSRKTDHIFYIPILKGSVWQISRYEKGKEVTISYDEFVKSLC